MDINCTGLNYQETGEVPLQKKGKLNKLTALQPLSSSSELHAPIMVSNSVSSAHRQSKLYDNYQLNQSKFNKRRHSMLLQHLRL
jgi:hypothetical protein